MEPGAAHELSLAAELDEAYDEHELPQLAITPQEFARHARSARFQAAFVEDLINALSLAIDLETRPTVSSGRRVSLIACLVAFELGIPRAEALYAAGLLRDVAAVGLPEHNLPYSVVVSHPKGKEILSHPDRGAKIVSQIPGVAPGTEDAIRDHHEWWQGQGYPRGKRGEEITIEGQILRLADTADQILRWARPRNADALMGTLEQLAGVEFSPEVYRAFASLLKRLNLVTELSDEWSISLLLRRVLRRLPRTVVPAGVDAMGTAATIFGRVIDSKHAYTQGHSERVARYSMLVANEMGIDHADVTRLRFASLLHDAGKLAIPLFILDKPGPLNEREWDVVRTHPTLTSRILGSMRGLRTLADVAGCHHERFDGTGYPRRLKGEEIPVLARIMSVADAFDAMTSARPYQPNRGIEQALEVLEENSGSQFWPEAVEAAVSVLPDAAAPLASSMSEVA